MRARHCRASRARPFLIAGAGPGSAGLGAVPGSAQACTRARPKLEAAVPGLRGSLQSGNLAPRAFVTWRTRAGGRVPAKGVRRGPYARRHYHSCQCRGHNGNRDKSQPGIASGEERTLFLAVTKGADIVSARGEDEASRISTSPKSSIDSDIDEFHHCSSFFRM